MKEPVSRSGAGAERDFIQIGQTNIGRDQINYNYYESSPAAEALEFASESGRQTRSRMIDVMRSSWIEGVLNQSLQLKRIRLGLEGLPDAVEQPLKLIVQESNPPTPEMRDGASITSIFDELAGTLLILGAPGSGKTTLLLELAQDLLGRAEQDPLHPLPVVFNLSPWNPQSSSFSEWLVEELKIRYSVPTSQGRAWVEHQQLLPLLDGLDEVASEHREECVQAINTFRVNQHGLFPLVVCCRQLDYHRMEGKLRLAGAVAIQPLDPKEVRRYLTEAGAPLAGVRAALRDDDSLRELMTTPLLLTIVAAAYWGMSASSIRASGSLHERRMRLFKAYTKAMFERRAESSPFTPQQTLHWLAWLARSLLTSNQTTFDPAWMQASWLRSRASRQVATVGTAVCLGLATALLIGLVWLLTLGIDAGAIGVFLFAPAVGMAVGRAAYSDTIEPAERLRWSWSTVLVTLRRSLGFGLTFYGTLAGLLAGALGFFLASAAPDQTADLVAHILRAGILLAILTGLTLGLLTGIPAGLVVEHRVPGAGSPGHSRPALRSAFLVAAPIAAPFALLGAILGLPGGYRYIVCCAATTAILAWMLAALRAGGRAHAQHLSLLLIMWFHDFGPPRYERFLNYATDRVLLYRIGGSYAFIHRLILEYFAATEPQPLEWESTQKSPLRSWLTRRRDNGAKLPAPLPDADVVPMVELGTITVPSGSLLLLGFKHCDRLALTKSAPASTVSLWQRLVAYLLNHADFHVVGPDASTAVHLLNLESPYLYDVRSLSIRWMRWRLKVWICIMRNGLDARLHRESKQVEPLARAHRVLASGSGSFLLGRDSAAAVTIPSGSFAITGSRWHEGHIHSIWSKLEIRIRDNRPPHRMSLLGEVAGGSRNLLIGDAVAIESWPEDQSEEGSADVSMWSFGSTAAIAASRFGAQRLRQSWGWRDLPLAEAHERAMEVRRWARWRLPRLLVTVREHSRRHRLLVKARSSRNNLGVLEHAGATLIAFEAPHAGPFPVHVEFDEQGNVITVSVTFSQHWRH